MFRPKCTVNGVKSKGRMCSQIIVNGRLCGYDGDCVYKEGHKPNQYALGYKAGLDAAVKVCRDKEKEFSGDAWEASFFVIAANAIAALPVPSCASNASLDVQWRDLTDDEIDMLIDVEEYIRTVANQISVSNKLKAVIAKFKEKQL